MAEDKEEKKEESSMMTKVVEMMFPLLVAGVGWLLTQITGFNTRLNNVESKMPMLLTQEGIVISSPQDTAARIVMKEELMNKINDLEVRIRLMEAQEGKK